MSEKPVSACLIRASAGTGKTYQLSNQFIKILLAGQEASSILATTFTRKAAGEIRERIIARLLAAATDQNATEELKKALDIAPQKDTDFYTVLRKVLQAQHTLRIYTLDSFFGGIGKAFAPELGLPEDWTIIDDSEEQSLVARSVTRILNDAVQKEEQDTISLLLQLLNANKVRSRVFEQLVNEFEQLFHIYRTSSADAWRNADVPEKPAFDSNTAILQLESAELPRTGKGEPHSQWVKALDKTINQIREGDWEECLKGSFIKPILNGESSYCRKPISDEMVSVCRPIIAHARYELLHRHYARTLVAYEFLRRFGEAYKAEQYESGGIRFFDVEQSLFESSLTEDFQHIHYRLDSEISHLLLDEFQDTSAGQWNIIKPLVDEITSRTAEGRTFFCVGDIKQAIYSWRGGVREIFDVLEDRYQGLSLEDMQHSYRSSPEVISFVNTIFKDIAENPALHEHAEAASIWAKGFIEHTSARDDLSGFVSIESPPRAEDGESQGDLVLEYAADVVRDKYLAHPHATIAVLVRTNSCIETLLELLRDEERQVPASQVGGIPLTSSPVVRLVLALLRFAEHPSDTLSHWQVRHSPLHVLLDTKQSMGEQAALIRQTISENGLGAQIAHWAHLLQSNLDAFEHTKLAQLSELAYSFSQGKGETLDDFIRAAEKKKVEDPSSNRVKIMTVHQAKGLEFDIVILPELDKRLNNITPHFICERPSATASPSRVTRYPNEVLQSLDPNLKRLVEEYKKNSLQESLCLLYVALTRAAHCLHLIVAPPKPDKTPCTLAGITLAAIQSAGDCDIESSVIYSAGDSDWARTITPASEKSSPNVDLPAPFSLAAPRVLDFLAGGASSTNAKLKTSSFELYNADALRWGSIMHALFECLEWLDDTEVEENVLTRVIQKASSSSTAVQPYLNAFNSILRQPLVRRVLSRGNYSGQEHDELKVYRELPFCLRIDGAFISGRIDRLVVGSKQGISSFADVIDFKTDVLSDNTEETLSAKVETYEPQMLIYQKVAARFTRLPVSAVSTRLLFLNSDQEVLIPTS